MYVLFNFKTISDFYVIKPSNLHFSINKYLNIIIFFLIMKMLKIYQYKQCNIKLLKNIHKNHWGLFKE